MNPLPRKGRGARFDLARMIQVPFNKTHTS